MKNVRLNALPAHHPKASKDCGLCRRRRIRCDRTLPRCVKCSIRRYSCPGFDQVKLRWNQGVASRGKLAGRAVPTASPSDAWEPCSGQSSQDLEVNQDESVERECRLYNRSEHPELLLGSDLVDRQISHMLSNKLLRYFQREVAARLRWLDGPSNPWRSLVPSLASMSKSVYLSLLNLAAAHQLATTTEDHEKAFLTRVRHSLQYSSLQTVRIKVCLELERGPKYYEAAARDYNVMELLASTLALCHGEMFTPHSTDWTCHLRACRGIIDRGSIEDGSKCDESLVAGMLTKEIIHLEAFQVVSTFNESQNLSQQLTPVTVFDDFTRFLYEVTKHERQQYTRMKRGEPAAKINMDAWERQLDQVLRLNLAGELPGVAHRAADQNHLNVVIRMQYSANLVYSYQALADESEAEETIPMSTRQLYEDLRFIATTSMYRSAHRIFWPLFIAGTEAKNETRRNFVEALFAKCISITGFWCNNPALLFLRRYWNSRSTQTKQTWIQYARVNEEAITAFLLF